MLKTPWGRNILTLFLTLSLGSIVLATRGSPTKAIDGNSVTVTGCLRTGDEAGEYSITSEDGKLYGLRSKTVALGKHVGHKVTVSGVKVREESAEKEESEKQEKAKEYADLQVTNLKMISEGCK
jgi:hypothetical protein